MRNPFNYFKTSLEIIRFAVMMHMRFPLSLRNVEDLLHERGIDITHETVRFWWNRLGRYSPIDQKTSCVERKLFELDLASRRGFREDHGETHYLWRAVDHEGEVLEAYVTKTRNRKAALNFLRKAMKRYGGPEAIVTDKLPSYKAALRGLGIVRRQETGRWLNNRVENSHQPLRRREKVMNRFRSARSLQKFAAIQSSVHNHFNLERQVYRRSDFKENRAHALAEWRQLVA